MFATETVVEFLGILVILVTFEILSQSYMKPMVNAIALQSILLSILFAVIGIQKHVNELMVIAVLTFSIRGVLIPSIISWDIKKNPIWSYRELETMVSSLVLTGVILAIIGYIVYRVIFHTVLNIRGGALPVVLLLLSFLIIIARKNAVAQLIGYISEENALLYASALLNLPIILEAGVFLDLLGIALAGIILAAEKEYGHVELEELVG